MWLVEIELIMRSKMTQTNVSLGRENKGTNKLMNKERGDKIIDKKTKQKILI